MSSDQTTKTSRNVAADKKVFVKTYGCQMNVYDSERMTEALQPFGYSPTPNAEDADLVILNTCHIREKAAEKVYSDLGRLKAVKNARQGKGLKTTIAVAGCVAQAEGKEIVARAPVADLVVGPQSYHRLPDLIFRAQSENKHVVETEFPENDKFGELPKRGVVRGSTPTAFLTVQEGCDKFCTFCVVPYTRGAEYSRPVDAVFQEARELAEAGVREITLLGQNVNAYHGAGPDGSDWSLAKLLDRLSAIEGLERLRYTTSHPRDMTDDLIAVHRDNPKVMPYLHLPFQAGSDRILAAMNRKHTAAEYNDIVARLRDANPDLALSTDIIVGFPGETDEDFKDTLKLVQNTKFASAYSFKYSPRPGTPASSIEEQVPEDVKTERLHRLQALLNAQQLEFNRGFVGREMQVLFERKGKHVGQLVGRSPWLQAVHAEADESLFGEMVQVRITSAGPNSLQAVVEERLAETRLAALG